jgi:transposase
LLKNSQTHPVPHRNAVRRLIEKYRETVSVLDAERSGRPSGLDDKKLMDISDCVLRSQSKSLRKLAQEKNTVDPRVTTGLTYEQLGLRQKF